MGDSGLPMTLEVSPKHDVVKTIFAIKEDNADVAKLSVEMLFDNAMIAAGACEEPRQMLPKLGKVLEMVGDRMY